MIRLACFLALAVAAVFGQAPQAANSLNEGVALFKSARYAQAAEAFQRAVAESPGDVNAHLYLATAYMSQYAPGVQTPVHFDLSTRADQEFQNVLGMQPDNMVALQSLASLHFQRAQGAPAADRLRELDEAARWYDRILTAQPQDATAHYSLGVIAWSKFYPELMSARSRLGMRPEVPGPLTDASVRADLRGRYGSVVDEGMRHLERALEINPQADDAMAYLNLLYRERADLLDSAAEYQRDVQIAENWVQRALETKRAKAASAGVTFAAAAPPPPPPPASGVRGGPVSVPKQIRISGNVQAAKLVEQPAPEYPPLARQARIQGVVRFNAVISRDGLVQQITLVSGHPLLVESATDAVRHWKYQPTLLNGEPVEVVTTVDVNFTLP